MKNKIWTCTRVVLPVVFTILLQMSVDMNVPPEESFYSKDKIFEVFLFIIFWYSLKVWKSNKNNYKRWSLFVGSVLAGFYVLGYNIEKYLDLFSQYNHNWMLGKLFLKWIVCWYCFSTLILFFYKKLDNLKYLRGGGKRENKTHSKTDQTTIYHVNICRMLATCINSKLSRNYL